MAKTSAIVTYTDQDGKTCQKALSDINPEASNAEIKTFAQKLLGLTDNTYVSTDRVDKVNCDTEASDGKLTPNFSLSATSGNLSSSSPNFSSVVTYDGDGTICFGNFTVNGAPLGARSLLCGCISVGDDKVIAIVFSGSFGNTYSGTYTVDVFFTETATYKATAPVTITITVS